MDRRKRRTSARRPAVRTPEPTRDDAPSAALRATREVAPSASARLPATTAHDFATPTSLPPTRDDALRAALPPLAPGERPLPLRAATALAVLLGVGNAIAYAAGATIGGRHPGPGVLAFSAAMGLLAAGMWARRYLAVLAFEALLALIVLVFSLFLVEAGNLAGLAVCVAMIAGGGWLLWKLVRVLGRLSVPAPPGQSSG